MAANNKNQKAVDRLLYPVAGGAIQVRDFLEDEGQRSLIDFGQYDYITKNALDGFNPLPQVLDNYIAQSAPDTWVLSAPEIAIINSYGRYPNFVALMADTGTTVYDITVSYIGLVGAFTSITVQLHSDGFGVNPDNTIVQFS